MPYCDAHAHLERIDPDAERTICCAVGPEDWPKLKALAEADHRLTPAYGVHPWRAEGLPAGWLEELESYLSMAPCCAGEMGLDNARPSPGQLEVFRAQLALAARLDRPCVIHCVRAWGEMLELLREYKPPRFMLHAYGGPPEMVKDFAALGGYFSFGASLLERPKTQAAFAAAPKSRRLLETDSKIGIKSLNYGDMILNYLEFIGGKPHERRL